MEPVSTKEESHGRACGVAWSSGLRKRVGHGGGRSFRFSEQNGEPLERFEERMSDMI